MLVARYGFVKARFRLKRAELCVIQTRGRIPGRIPGLGGPRRLLAGRALTNMFAALFGSVMLFPSTESAILLWLFFFLVVPHMALSLLHNAESELRWLLSSVQKRRHFSLLKSAIFKRVRACRRFTSVLSSRHLVLWNLRVALRFSLMILIISGGNLMSSGHLAKTFLVVVAFAAAF